MKNNIIIAIASVAMMLCASCEKSLVAPEKEVGYLSFSEFSLGLDETVDTRATAAEEEEADGTYTIKIFDAEENVVKKMTYEEVLEMLESDDNLSLPAGDYTLVASSSSKDVPYAAFEKPVYGVSHRFTIEAGAVTEFTEPLVCTLLQCKVTVAYNDEFLKHVTGPGKTTVTVTAGHSLDYALNYEDGKCAYDQSAGYFAVKSNTMTVVFSGNIEGKTAKMTKTFTNIAPKQWRQIRFVAKTDEQGDATFDIVINDLVDDKPLDSGVDGSEDIIGEDPDAPKGDGGITLDFDRSITSGKDENDNPIEIPGCDPEITDLRNIKIVPVEERDMVIKLKATVPNGVKKFTVDIASTNNAFTAAVAAADASHLDLISPSEANAIIFEVVPFPHGQELLGQTDIPFNLSAAQDAIINYKGTHTFTMTIVDEEGCRNAITVVMVVE